MARTALFLKIVVEHETHEQPAKLGEAFRRQLLKLYGVRSVEVSNYTSEENWEE